MSEFFLWRFVSDALLFEYNLRTLISLRVKNENCSSVSGKEKKVKNERKRPLAKEKKNLSRSLHFVCFTLLDRQTDTRTIITLSPPPRLFSLLKEIHIWPHSSGRGVMKC